MAEGPGFRRGFPPDSSLVLVEFGVVPKNAGLVEGEAGALSLPGRVL
jgi:hypothetical protein